jgi:hypothetical protein
VDLNAAKDLNLTTRLHHQLRNPHVINVDVKEATAMKKHVHVALRRMRRSKTIIFLRG